MNSTPASRNDTSASSSQFDALESLEARLWDRARRNLRLLYNGGSLAPIAATSAKGVVGPLAVTTKI